ncbi:MAG: hypothetical protein Q9165_003265 [Trypethelium subeluteriae]
MKFNIHVFLALAASLGAVSAIAEDAADVLQSLSERDASDVSAGSSLHRRVVETAHQILRDLSAVEADADPASELERREAAESAADILAELSERDFDDAEASSLDKRQDPNSLAGILAALQSTDPGDASASSSLTGSANQKRQDPNSLAGILAALQSTDPGDASASSSLTGSANQKRQDPNSLAGILAALQSTDPGDASASSSLTGSANQKRQDPNSLAGILAALQSTDPGDASASSSLTGAANQKRQDPNSLAGILAALQSTDPGDASASSSLNSANQKRQDPNSLAGILAALQSTDPGDASASSSLSGSANQKRQDPNSLAGILAALQSTDPGDASASSSLNNSPSNRYNAVIGQAILSQSPPTSPPDENAAGILAMAAMQGINSNDSVHDEDRIEVQLRPVSGSYLPQKLRKADATSAEAVNLRNPVTDESDDHTSEQHHRRSNDMCSQASPKQRVRNIGQATKAKARRVLHGTSKGSKKESNKKDHEEESEQESLAENHVIEDVKQNPAFSPKQLIRKKGISVSSTIDATYGTTKGTLHAVAHPRRALKAKAAKKLATPEHPYLSPEADLQLLDTHDEMVRIQSSRAASSAEASSDRESECERLEQKMHDLESDREKAKVAWITSRHIFRARVVPKQHFDFPIQSDYYDQNEDGTAGRFRYERYIGAIMLYYSQDFTSQYIDDFNTLPFNKDTLIRHMERLVMVSAPWQEWFLNVRRVYRWEDPQKTGKWLAIILTMWYYNHMVTFLVTQPHELEAVLELTTFFQYSYLIFVTVRRRFRPESIDEIRLSYERALSRGTQALRLSELISKHGNDKWLDPLLDEIGPIVQLQIGDLADLLEIYQNCYDWRDPWMTTSTLIFLMTCILVGHFTSMEFSVKILEWIGILYFFFSRPIASLQPKFRHMVSPVKWTVWDIPTHAEWAFRYLRSEAQNARAAIIGHRVTEKHLAERINPAGPEYDGSMELPVITKTTSTGEKVATGYDSDDSAASYETASSSTSAIGGEGILSFRCRWHTKLGRLVLFGSGLRFSSSFPSHGERWSRSYMELVEIQKQSPETRIGRAATLEVLQLHWTDGTITELMASRGCRDEMFNCVLGFSGLKWQALQPLGDGLKTKHKREKEENSNGTAQ